jgi:hypothetical protein
MTSCKIKTFRGSGPTTINPREKKMSYQTEAFIDIMRLSARNGMVPKAIPDHYWRYCWAMRRQAMGNPIPAVGWRDAATRQNVICLEYRK